MPKFKLNNSDGQSTPRWLNLPTDWDQFTSYLAQVLPLFLGSHVVSTSCHRYSLIVSNYRKHPEIRRAIFIVAPVSLFAA